MKTGLRVFWLILGTLSLLFGFVGLFLPIVPTVPFVLLAAFAFSQSSEKLHRWLLDHPLMGPPIRDWNERGAVGRRAKWVATLSMAGSVGLALFLGLPPPAVLAQAVVVSAVAVFLWSRPDR